MKNASSYSKNATQAGNGSPWRNKTALTLCFGEVLLMMGFGFLGPILPKFVQELGVAKSEIGAMVGLVVTTFGIARVIMDIPTGRLTRRWGRRPLLIIAPALVAISALGSGLATEYWQLVAFRFLQGIGSALFSVVAIIAIGEISTVAHRGQYLSMYWASFLLGGSLGPTFGGLVGGYLGYRAPFFCLAGLSLLAALWFYLRIPETKKEQTSVVAESPTASSFQADLSEKQAPLYRDLNFVLISAVALFTLVNMSGTQVTLVPLLGYERLGLREVQVGLALTLVATMQFSFVFLSGRLSDKLGRKNVIVPGGIITVLGTVLFTLSRSYPFFLMSGVVLGIGRGTGGAVPTAYAADIAQKRNYEHTIALFRFISDIGFVIGPVFLGWLKDLSGFNFPMLLSAGLLFTVVTLFGILARETVSRGHR